MAMAENLCHRLYITCPKKRCIVVADRLFLYHCYTTVVIPSVSESQKPWDQKKKNIQIKLSKVKWSISHLYILSVDAFIPSSIHPFAHVCDFVPLKNHQDRKLIRGAAASLAQRNWNRKRQNDETWIATSKLCDAIGEISENKGVQLKDSIGVRFVLFRIFVFVKGRIGLVGFIWKWSTG